MSQEISRRALLTAGIAVGAVAGLGRSAAAEAGGNGGGTIALRNVTAIDATGSPPRPGLTVIVKDGWITALGRARDLRIPRGARVVDGTGKFLIPGLCDMHVHSVDAEVEQVFAPLFLANGVTTVREMAGTPFLHAWRRRVERGEVLGPRSVIGSPLLDGKPSLWEGIPGGARYFEVTNEAQARQAVRQVKRDGADFVKVYSRLSRDAFLFIADEARRQRIPFAGHLPDVVPLREASQAGMRSVEHTWGVWYATSSREAEIYRALAEIRVGGGDYNGWFNQIHPLDWMAVNSHDPGKAAAAYAQLAANRTWQVPTLMANQVIAMPDDFSGADERLRYVPRSTAETWIFMVEELYKAGRTPQIASQHRQLFEHRLRVVGAMHRAGVPIMAGTDTAAAYTYPGFALHDELELLVRAGLTPMRALQSATVEPARFLGRQDWAGTIREGKVADLVLLDADPLTDIRNTRRVHAVLAAGRLISAGQRERMLQDVAAAAGDMLQSPIAFAGRHDDHAARTRTRPRHQDSR
ncbi:MULTISPECIES: amidohydrolase family protein [unclassified Streptosporangium]|uniref:amidohydrolase family protein n=1 Tax=unclassified Streptosporangium TaxID=2632669 RepID=UPI002E2A8564|nr:MULTISPECIES: amidohydrolase family protein [unclassified Streptosporangium]